MSTSTIELTGGLSERTSRIALKRAMTAFGEVDACHMGDRAVMGDRFTEFPIVRFRLQSSAEAALQAIKAGQVFLDGQQLQGEWRGGGGLAVRQRLKPQRSANSAPLEEDTSSRMLLDMPASNSQRLDSHNTFMGRDQRRDEAALQSSRRLLDGPVDRAGGGRPRRGRSRSRSRSRSRRRRRSRSRSPKKAHNRPFTTSIGPPVPQTAGVAFASSIFKILKPQDPSSIGNLEQAMSDNPLYVAQA